MTLDEVNTVLERGRARVGAASCTFYVRDPFWPDALRLVAMPGVKLKEPMYGFSSPHSAKSVIAERDTEAFSIRITKEEQLSVSASKTLAIEKLDPDTRRLFGSFAEREAIVCSAEILRALNGQIEALLFVNFDAEKQFDASLKKILNSLLDEVTKELPSLRKELEQSEAEALVQVVRILQPALDVVSTRQEQWKSFLEDYFHSVLKVSLAATSIKPGSGLGTIHLYDEETSTLRLAAMEGEIKQSERAQSVWVRSGHGVISWVAMRQNPLLISDLKNSEFEKIHISLNKRVRSEVAIPMMSGERLLGVLNLESFKRDAFRAGCVRSLWFAANRAAVAFELSEQARINSDLKTLSDGLMELWRHWIEDEGADSFLDELARLAATHVDADRCGIWRYNNGRFEDFGLSYRAPIPTPPRADGWSNIIRRSKRPIWIYGIGKKDEFRVWYWVPNFWTIEPPTSRSVPDEVSTGVVKQGVQALLGIPILLHDECVGVAWLEYQRDSPKIPSVDVMRRAHGFASQAGLFMVLMERQAGLAEEKSIQVIAERLGKRFIAEGPLPLEKFRRIEGYVTSQASGPVHVGGDFYAARVVDEETAGIVLGDGEGHGVPGLLNMLSLVTMFEAFWSDSRSTTHVMDKIIAVSNRLDVHGTAIYCIFTIIGKSLWLSVTSAGHAPLIILRAGPHVFACPAEGSTASGGMIGHPLKTPLAAERTEVHTGDIIIAYTDGVGELITREEMVGIGLHHLGDSTANIAKEIFASALNKNPGHPLEDDATVLVVRVN